MSNIRLQGNPSGTGTLTIASPNTNSDFTLNLPTANGTIPLLATVTNNGVMFVNSSGQPTTGSALTFDGTKLTVRGGNAGQLVLDNSNEQYVQQIFQRNATANTGADLLLDGSGNTFSFRGLAANMPFVWSLSTTAGNPSEQMRLTSTGLGIGTSSPAQKLHVLADTSGALFQGATLGGVTFLKTGQTGMQLFSDATGTLKVYDNNAGAAVLTVSNQNVGIGTSSPSYSLDVITPNTNGFAGARIRNNDTGSSAYAGLILNAYGNTWSMRMGSVAANSNALQFVVDQLGSPTVRATLDTSGNLGLGVTPSAWGGGQVAFQVKNASLSGFSNSAYMMANTYYDGTNEKYIASSFAGKYAQASGAHIWYNAPSGTAGTAISFTQAMTLDASGDLALGTTSITSASGSKRTLELNGSSSSILNLDAGGTRRAQFYADASVSVLGTTTAIPLAFYTNDTERARIDSSGNVGIGTSSPSGKLEVVGAIRGILNSGQGGQSLIGAISGVSNGYEVSVTTGNVQNYYWHNGGTRSMTLDSSDNLLVGTTSNANGSRIVSNGVIQSTSGGFRFPDGTVQTTAASGAPTTLYAVGTYILGRPTNTTQYLADATIAGSSLRNTGPFGYWNGSNLVSALDGSNINAQSPTVNVGTWRCVSVALGGAAAGAGMWLRIS